MNTSAQEFYQQEFDSYFNKNTLLTAKIKSYSRIRIAWFLLGMVAIYFASTTNWFWVSILVLVFLLVFVIIAVQHGRLIDKKKEYAIFLILYQDELNALKGDYTSYDSGKEFIDPQHPFANDLDLFGKESVFQMLNRHFSKAGKTYLATVLKTLEKEKNTIRVRQKAVEELSKTQKWLTQFRALGILAFSKESSFSPDPNTLAETLPLWIDRKSIFKNKLFQYAQYILPVLSFFVLLFYVFGSISSSVFILYIIISLGFTGFYTKQINKQHQELSKQSDVLFHFQKLISHIEKAEFKTEGLQKIQRDFYCETKTASHALKNLGRITQAFDTRLNIFAWLILNYFLLWDIRQSIRLENWKSRNNKLPKKVFKAIAEMETLTAFATFYYNRNDLVFPEIIDEGFEIEGKQVGHPLMLEDTRVDNDVLFPSSGKFYVITGANMAGKSTYLRTVGVNLILALSGAPVCAKEFKTSVLQPFTSIKTSDSLSNNESYFYAELLRLQRIIEALKTGQPYFIILDEILKGTNSKDKEQGSKALVKQLIGLHAAGIIATHDLQLAELRNNFPENIKTACFEVEIENEQLVFDYKLRAGVSQNLNATFLMKKMGIS